MQATRHPISGFSADTEILTRLGGWVTFGRLTCLDEVATRSPDGRFEWQSPERVTWQPYQGDMVWLHSRTTDLMVTPGTEVLYLERHRVMRAGQRVELPYTERSTAARDAVGHRVPLVATSRWEPASKCREFTFTAERAPTSGARLGMAPKPLTIGADDFAAFMGMYLAEGSLDSIKKRTHGIAIWQKHAGRGFTEYQELINRVAGYPVPHNTKAGEWRVSRKALYEYLMTCGKYAWGKCIPSEVLDLSPSGLEKFWQFYSIGDGTVMSAPGRKNLDVISTTSMDMAGRFQEVLQKLGGWGLIQVVDFRKYSNPSGINAARLTYRIVRRAGTVAFASVINRTPYAGMLGAVRVDAPAVYVRRNNRPVWSGT